MAQIVAQFDVTMFNVNIATMSDLISLEKNKSRLKSSFKTFYKKSRGSVIIRFEVNGKSYDFQTSIRCSPKQMDRDSEIKLQIDEHYDYLANSIIQENTIQHIRKNYYSSFHKRKSVISLNYVVEKFMLQHRGIMAPDHLRKFTTVRKSLTQCLGFEIEQEVPLTMLTDESINDYIKYLLKKGLENSSVKNHIKILKRIVRYANDDLRYGLALSLSAFTLKEKQPFVVFLSRGEVSYFEKVETTTPGELEVKNGFLFRCYTGIRFSDVPYIGINNLDGQVLSFYIPKTSKSHQIPLNRKAIELLLQVKKFNPISQQKENKYIKKLAKRAGIDRVVQKIKLSGSKCTVETHPKWKLCSSHTARRTWARVAYESGVDILKISRYIGHSDISTTLKYIGHKDTDFDELKNLFN